MTRPRILVCLSAHSAWYAGTVRNIMESPVNHTFLLYESVAWGGFWATEVANKGVQKLPARRVLDDQDVVYYWEYQYDLSPGLQAMRKYIGAGYDYLALLWGLFRIWLSKKLNISIFTPMHFANKMMCSEFVAGVLKGAKVVGTEDWEPSSISPEDLRQFLNINPGFRQVDCPV